MTARSTSAGGPAQRRRLLGVASAAPAWVLKIIGESHIVCYICSVEPSAEEHHEQETSSRRVVADDDGRLRCPMSPASPFERSAARPSPMRLGAKKSELLLYPFEKAQNGNGRAL